MSLAAVDGLRAQVENVVQVFGGLDDASWSAPSACAGWSAQDVLAHLSASFKALLDPSETADLPEALTLEQSNDVGVDKRRSWSRSALLEEYQSFAPLAVETFASFQEPPLADEQFPLRELGTYKMSQLAEAICFDHVVHLYCDLAGPRGPLALPLPELDVSALTPTIDWMLAGLPQMSPPVLGEILVEPLRLVLEGPGGRAVDLVPAEPAGGLISILEAADDRTPLAEVVSSAQSFLTWSTKRSAWRDSVSVSGRDVAYGAKLLDAIRVV